MKLRKSKFPFYYILGLGLLNIIEGLIMILSLGFYTTDGISLKYVINYHKKIKNANINRNF